MMLAWTPSLVLFAWLLWRAPLVSDESPKAERSEPVAVEMKEAAN
jgi:hypothetical protein